MLFLTNDVGNITVPEIPQGHKRSYKDAWLESYVKDPVLETEIDANKNTKVLFQIHANRKNLAETSVTKKN